MNRSAGGIAAVCAWLLAAGPSLAADGLTVRTEPLEWPRWQARLGVTTAPRVDAPVPGPLYSARLLGDYYFTGPGFGGGRIGGGLRATSGVFTGPRAATFSLPTVPLHDGSLFSLSSRPLAATGGLGFDAPKTGAVSYLGVGYTGVSAHGGWGFTADIGLMAHNPSGGGIRFGRQDRTPPLDDLLHDLRLTPVLQLGVSYSF